MIGDVFIVMIHCCNDLSRSGPWVRAASLKDSFSYVAPTVILNLAIKVGELEANPLSGITAPDCGAPDRMPEPVEIAKIFEFATTRLRRVLCVGMSTALRRKKVWRIRQNMIVCKPDGP